MNRTIRQETAGEAFGVAGRFFAVVAADDGRILNQTFKANRYNEAGDRCQVTVRFDDGCNNGHESFSVTGYWWESAHKLRCEPDACGCIHEQVAEFFPELAHLIRWHLASTDGPWGYVSNAVYHAGDRDCWGHRKGEPSAWDYFVVFGGFPVPVKVSKRFADFLAEARGLNGRYRGAGLDAVAVPHGPNKGGIDHKFADKYTLTGFACEWYNCPFDSLREAEEFIEALRWADANGLATIEKRPTAWSDGKARELDAARHCAVWPEATDAELLQEPDALKAALLARLPGLLAAFRADVEGFGFLWPERTREVIR